MRPEPKDILIRAWTRTKVLTDELEISPAGCAIDLFHHVSFSLETFTSRTWWASLVRHEPKIIGRAVPRSAVRSPQFIYHLSRLDRYFLIVTLEVTLETSGWSGLPVSNYSQTLIWSFFLLIKPYDCDLPHPCLFHTSEASGAYAP